MLLRASFCGLLLLAAPCLAQDVVIRRVLVNPPGNDASNVNTEMIVLHNASDEPADMTGWSLELSPGLNDDGVDHFPFPAGHTIEAGETRTILWYLSVSDATGDLGRSLYAPWGHYAHLDNDAGDLALVSPDGPVHYVAWGQPGQRLESIAAEAGIWTVGAVAPTPGEGEWLVYGGHGFAATDWFLSRHIEPDGSLKDGAEVILSAFSGDLQQGPVGRIVAAPLVVLVRDANGAPLAGVEVSFDITEGGGRVQPWTATTRSNGQVSVLLVLGSYSGATVVQASADNAEPICFTATAYDPGDLPAPSELRDHALRLDGSQRQEVELPQVSSTGDEYTVEAWIWTSDSIPEREEGGNIVGQHASTEDAKGSLDIYNKRLRIMLTTQTEGYHELPAEELLPLAEWTHVAGVYDGARLLLYVNGEVAGTLPCTGTITSYVQRRTTRIGGYPGTSTQPLAWFTGAIDEVRIWDVARTREQLQADMHGPIEPQSGLIGYWRLDEGEGETTADFSGNGHVGVLTNYRGVGMPHWVSGVFTGDPVDETGVAADSWGRIKARHVVSPVAR